MIGKEFVPGEPTEAPPPPVSLGEVAAEVGCCDSFEVAVESWPSGIWVTDSNTEKGGKKSHLEFRRLQNLMTSRGYQTHSRSRSLVRFLCVSEVI